MIMLITDQAELRDQLRETLLEGGQTVATPPHRQDMLTTLKDSQPDLIVLDLYVSDPSGVDDLKVLRDHGYRGRLIVLAGPSIMPAVTAAQGSGVVSLLVPPKINGRFHLGELLSTINTCLKQDLQEEATRHHARIAERAYE
jgi:DNA-binding NtrC family response regulator